MHFVKMLKRVVLRVRLPCRLTVVSTVPTKLLKAHLCAHISRIFSVCPLCRRHIYLGIYKGKKIDLGSCFNWIVHAQRMEFIGLGQIIRPLVYIQWANATCPSMDAI